MLTASFLLACCSFYLPFLEQCHDCSDDDDYGYYSYVYYDYDYQTSWRFGFSLSLYSLTSLGTLTANDALLHIEKCINIILIS